MSHKSKIKEAFPELETNEFIMQLAEELDSLTKIKSFSNTEVGRFFCNTLQSEISLDLQKLIMSVDKTEKEKDAMILSIKEKLFLILRIKNVSSDCDNLQKVLDDEIKTIIG